MRVKAVKLLTRIHRWFCVKVAVLLNNLALNMWDESSHCISFNKPCFNYRLLQLPMQMLPDAVLCFIEKKKGAKFKRKGLNTSKKIYQSPIFLIPKDQEF